MVLDIGMETRSVEVSVWRRDSRAFKVARRELRYTVEKKSIRRSIDYDEGNSADWNVTDAWEG